MTRVSFYSNYLNHYQLPFSLKMCELTNNDYFFISQKAISTKRISLGFRNLSDENAFVVKTYENDEELKRAYDLALSSDYVIFGATKDDYVTKRIKNNQITFEYSERLNKRRPSLYLWIKKYLNMLVYRCIYKNKKLFLLCNGTYVSGDFKEFNMYQGKSYKWGYFPPFINHDIEKLIDEKEKKPISIIWAGRLINWKHPDLLIKLAIELKKNNYVFNINIAGNGEMEDELKSLIHENHLNDCVCMLGSMPPEEVRKYMEKSCIYLFTSDYQEGWGVVLNEAMNSGCACVASHAAGSTGYLLNHKENGLIYESGNFDDLYNCVKTLFDNKDYMKQLGINAYNTIKNTWNADVAAERFLILAECLNSGKETPFKEGPCSIAYPIKNKEAYNYLVK